MVATVAEPVARRMPTAINQASSSGESACSVARRASRSDNPPVTSTCFSAPPAPIDSRIAPAGPMASVQILPCNPASNRRPPNSSGNAARLVSRQRQHRCGGRRHPAKARGGGRRQQRHHLAEADEHHRHQHDGQRGALARRRQVRCHLLEGRRRDGNTARDVTGQQRAGDQAGRDGNEQPEEDGARQIRMQRVDREQRDRDAAAPVHARWTGRPARAAAGAACPHRHAGRWRNWPPPPRWAAARPDPSRRTAAGR